MDVTITGFEMAEIDLLIGDLGPGDDNTVEDPDNETPDVDVGPAVTQPGDIWIIGGKHRLICGDATNPETFSCLLDGKQAQMVFTDPPYNVQIDGHVSGLGKVKHREFAMAAGEMTGPEFEAFLAAVLSNLATFNNDGAIHYVCMGLVFVFKSGRGRHINNVDLGRHGRYRTNVWDYAGANTLSASRQDDLAMHPTVKPVALVADAILDTSNRGGIVLDAFAGSGTTLVAAVRTGRRSYGIELDPLYCDVIVRRACKNCRSSGHPRYIRPELW